MVYVTWPLASLRRCPDSSRVILATGRQPRTMPPGCPELHLARPGWPIKRQAAFTGHSGWDLALLIRRTRYACVMMSTNSGYRRLQARIHFSIRAFIAGRPRRKRQKSISSGGFMTSSHCRRVKCGRVFARSGLLSRARYGSSKAAIGNWAFGQQVSGRPSPAGDVEEELRRRRPASAPAGRSQLAEQSLMRAATAWTLSCSHCSPCRRHVPAVQALARST